MVSFREISNNIKTPGQFLEFDPSGAASGRETHVALLQGYRTDGSMAELTPAWVVGELDGYGYFGERSMLGAMCERFRKVNKNAKLLAIAHNDDPAGVAATGTFTIAGTSTAVGTIALYIAGKRIPVLIPHTDASPVSAGAAAILAVAAVNAEPRLPATASASGGAVTVTCAWTGPSGNDILLAKNTRQDDADVPGLTVTVAAMSGGANPADVDAGIAVYGDTRYDTIASGLNDPASIAKMEAMIAARWNGEVQLEGSVFHAMRGSHGTLTTAAASRNAFAGVLIGAGLSPTPSWIWAAQWAAEDAAATEADVNAPRLGRPLPDCLPPPSGSEFTRSERNLLLKDGIATYKLDGGGNPVIENIVTTYTTNVAGVADDSMEDHTTVRAMAWTRQSWRAWYARFGDNKLGDDGTQVDPGVKLMTPTLVKANALAWFKAGERLGILENFDQFKDDLVALRDEIDVNRVNALIKPDYINKFGVIATVAAFRR